MILPLEKQVVSLPLAQKMKEMGIEAKQEKSLFVWVMDTETREYKLTSFVNPWHKAVTDYYAAGFDNVTCPMFSAYTVAELGEIIAPHSHSFKSNDKWQCEYWFEVEDHTGNMDCDVFEADTEADARALCAIYLKEHNLI